MSSTIGSLVVASVILKDTMFAVFELPIVQKWKTLGWVGAENLFRVESRNRVPIRSRDGLSKSSPLALVETADQISNYTDSRKRSGDM